ncbi:MULTISPECIES: hypothetical protein [unclassified Erwinia]|nr:MULTISPECIES: hypothetical protein [unclassified Erwinia]
MTNPITPTILVTMVGLSVKLTRLLSARHYKVQSGGGLLAGADTTTAGT